MQTFPPYPQKRARHFVQTLVLMLAISGVVLANDEIKERIQATNTQHVDLAAGGTVRLKNSTGELSIEAWDQPGVEITTVKSTKAEYTSTERERLPHVLDDVKVTTDSKGGELVITTDFSKNQAFPPFLR